jgi:uncharacterized membrane protein
MQNLDTDRADILEELRITGLSSINKDLAGIESILALRGQDLSVLTEKKLSEYIYTATQYQLYLQFHYNVRYVEYLKAKRKFDVALNRELVKMTSKQTVKEKIAEAMQQEDLAILESNVASLEAKYNLLNKIPESFSELANALKKDLSLRARPGKDNVHF